MKYEPNPNGPERVPDSDIAGEEDPRARRRLAFLGLPETPIEGGTRDKIRQILARVVPTRINLERPEMGVADLPYGYLHIRAFGEEVIVWLYGDDIATDYSPTSTRYRIFCPEVLDLIAEVARAHPAATTGREPNSAALTESRTPPDVQAWISTPEYIPGGAADVVWDYVAPQYRAQASQVLADRSFIPLTLAEAREYAPSIIARKPKGTAYMVRCVASPSSGLLHISYYNNGWLRVNFINYEVPEKRETIWRELRRMPVIVFLAGDIAGVQVNIAVVTGFRGHL